MSEHDRVVVHVDDPGVRGHGLDDLMCVARRRDAGPYVKELAHPRVPGEVADGAPEERPVRAHGEGHVRPRPEPGLDRRPIGRVVGFAPQQGIMVSASNHTLDPHDGKNLAGTGQAT